MNRKLLLLTAALAAAAPTTAQADAVVDPAPGAVNVSAGGGYAVWAAPEEDTGWQLVVRAPDGTVTRPAIDDFAGPPDPSVGSGGGTGTRPLLAVYSRRVGGSDDVYALDLATGKEHRVSAISTAGADELAPSVQQGRLAFVRSGGERPGVYVWNGKGAARRISPTVAGQTAINESRVAYATARSVVVRRASDGGQPHTFTASARPRSIVLTRYRLGWLEDEGVVRLTDRVQVAGAVAVRTATRTLNPSTQSVAVDGDEISLRLGNDGLQRIDPELTFGG